MPRPHSVLEGGLNNVLLEGKDESHRICNASFTNYAVCG